MFVLKLWISVFAAENSSGVTQYCRSCGGRRGSLNLQIIEMLTHSLLLRSSLAVLISVAVLLAAPSLMIRNRDASTKR